jgi:hypothetical protein
MLIYKEDKINNYIAWNDCVACKFIQKNGLRCGYEKTINYEKRNQLEKGDYFIKECRKSCSKILCKNCILRCQYCDIEKNSCKNCANKWGHWTDCSNCNFGFCEICPYENEKDKIQIQIDDHFYCHNCGKFFCLVCMENFLIECSKCMYDFCNDCINDKFCNKCSNLK